MLSIAFNYTVLLEFLVARQLALGKSSGVWLKLVRVMGLRVSVNRTSLTI